MDLLSEYTKLDFKQKCADLFEIILLPIPEHVEGNREVRLKYWNALSRFEQLLFDSNKANKIRIANAYDRHINKNAPIERFIKNYIPNPAEIPQDKKAILALIYSHYNYPKKVNLLLSGQEIYTILNPYFKILSKYSKTNYFYALKRIWDVFSFADESVKEAFLIWIANMENQQVFEPHFGIHIQQALDWNEDLDLKTVTKSDFEAWINCLDHTNPALRGIAAKNLGLTFVDWIDKSTEFSGESMLSLENILKLVQEKQIEGKQVLGGFIQGICTDCGHLSALKKHKSLVNNTFDLDGFLIETAIKSPEIESYLPGSQAFWFYLHEYFDFNPQAVHQLIDGERYWIAMMCITESLFYGSYPCMKEVIDRIINEGPDDISKETKRQVQIFLKKQ